jgi:2,3-diaminopropionate biosynthesis protein SbnB
MSIPSPAARKQQRFHVVPGVAIKTILEESRAASIDIIARTYLEHDAGKAINPASCFLRFPDAPANRFIALPASIASDHSVAGIKWIGSYPGNINEGLPRASAILVLNDPTNGYPYALLEGAMISAARTAASAVLGAFWLRGRDRMCDTLSIIGAGVIARTILEMFVADEWQFRQVKVHDLDAGSCEALGSLARSQHRLQARAADGLADALRGDVVVFATNAGTPHVNPPLSFVPGQVILNISLRDLAPELVVGAQNVFDDVGHCMTANTSPHLAEQKYGHRDFVTGTIAQVMRGEAPVTRDRPVIYSPFGMGILDLALGKAIFDIALTRGVASEVPGFFGELARW